MIKKSFIYFLILIFCLFALTGCSEIDVKENDSITDKVDEEINYLEDEIFMLVNKFAKDEYKKEEDEINWEEIIKDTQNISSVLDTVMLDLAEVSISNDDLVKLRNECNNIFIATGNNEEYGFLQKCSYVYSLLPEMMDKYSEDKNRVNIMRLKSFVLTSFIQAHFKEWDQAKLNVASAENKYKEMMDNIDYMKEYSYNLNKIYVLLEEYKTSIDNEQIEIVTNKYINFIEKSP